MRGHFNSREVTARQPTRDRVANDELQNRTSVKLYKVIQDSESVNQPLSITHCVKTMCHTSQLSRINDFSIGHPPSSLNISQTVLESDSQSERSTSCKDWQCRTNVVRFSCFWRANLCNQNEEILTKIPTNGTV